MADVRWQDIVKKISTENYSKKLIHDTVQVFYSSLESNIVPGCNISVRNIGSFKGTKAGVKHIQVLKKFNKRKYNFYNTRQQRRKRLWAKELFDKHWID